MLRCNVFHYACVALLPLIVLSRDGLGKSWVDEVSDYIVIVDAGSTGTRIHAFHYHTRRITEYEFPMVIDPPLTVPMQLAEFKAKPGLSALKCHVDDFSSHMSPLFRAAADALHLHDPMINLKLVPIYVGGTAGLRILSHEKLKCTVSALREALRGPENPFAFVRDEQARVLSGEEEAAFAWLAVNHRLSHISPNPGTTFGSIDFGVESVQIAFVPFEASFLAGMFPMHFGGHVQGPIHIYTHSFTRFGFAGAWQLATEKLVSSSTNWSSIDHPCMPQGLVWNVVWGQFGVSTVHTHPERSHGNITLRGSGNSSGCRALAKGLVPPTVCMMPPCSTQGVYQPQLNSSKFVVLGEHRDMRSWEVQVLIEDSVPFLQGLRRQLPLMCALTMTQQLELFGSIIGSHSSECWRAVWMYTLLVDGLQFNIDTPNLLAPPRCCYHVLGQAIYEVNFFPYRIERDSFDFKRTNFAFDPSSTDRPPISATKIGSIVVLSSVFSFVTGLYVSRVVCAVTGHAPRCHRLGQYDGPLLVE